jgi:enamine deaminase RidA (YjgF/YER057c/UK114 family)
VTVELDLAGKGRRMVAALVVAALVSGSATARAQSQGNPSLVGTWTLVAADRQLKDGTRSPDYGEHPQGRLIVDANGRYSLQIFRSDRARFDLSKGTADEYKAALLGMSTHYGEIAVDWANHTLRITPDQASDPNRIGQVQTRPFEFDGEVLSYRQPPRADGSFAISVWRRDPQRASPSSSDRPFPPGRALPAGTSTAVWAGNTLYVSGALDPDLETHKDTESQTVGLITYLQRILESQQLTLRNVAMMRVFLSADPAKGGKMDFDGMMAGYTRFFGTKDQPNKPARTTVQVVLPAGVRGALIEIDLVAVRPE